MAAYLENKLEKVKLEAAAVIKVSGDGGLAERAGGSLKRPGIE